MSVLIFFDWILELFQKCGFFLAFYSYLPVELASDVEIGAFVGLDALVSVAFVSSGSVVGSDALVSVTFVSSDALVSVTFVSSVAFISVAFLCSAALVAVTFVGPGVLGGSNCPVSSSVD